MAVVESGKFSHFELFGGKMLQGKVRRTTENTTATTTTNCRKIENNSNNDNKLQKNRRQEGSPYLRGRLRAILRRFAGVAGFGGSRFEKLKQNEMKESAHTTHTHTHTHTHTKDCLSNFFGELTVV